MRKTVAAIVTVFGLWCGGAPAQDFSGADPAPPPRAGRGTPLPIIGRCAPARDCPTTDELLAAARDWEIRAAAATRRGPDNGAALPMAPGLVSRLRAVRCGAPEGQARLRVTCRMTRLYRGRLPNYIRAELVRDQGVWRFRQVVPDLRYGLSQ